MSLRKRVSRNVIPSLNDCSLEGRSSTSAMGVGLIPTVPTQVVIPVGPGHIYVPTNIQDPTNWPAGDGHNLPGFETDPGLPPVDCDPTTPITGLGGHSTMIV